MRLTMTNSNTKKKDPMMRLTMISSDTKKKGRTRKSGGAMKRLTLLAALLLGTTLTCRAQGADYTVDRLRHEFGALAAGMKCSTSFTVSSTGEAPLVLIDAQTGCKCTKATFGKKPLRKGEKTIVTVTFDATERGAFDKQIRIRTNASGERAVLVLRITGNVK